MVSNVRMSRFSSPPIATARSLPFVSASPEYIWYMDSYNEMRSPRKKSLTKDGNSESPRRLICELEGCQQIQGSLPFEKVN